MRHLEINYCIVCSEDKVTTLFYDGFDCCDECYVKKIKSADADDCTLHLHPNKSLYANIKLNGKVYVVKLEEPKDDVKLIVELLDKEY